MTDLPLVLKHQKLKLIVQAEKFLVLDLSINDKFELFVTIL